MFCHPFPKRHPLFQKTKWTKQPKHSESIFETRISVKRCGKTFAQNPLPSISEKRNSSFILILITPVYLPLSIAKKELHGTHSRPSQTIIMYWPGLHILSSSHPLSFCRFWMLIFWEALKSKTRAGRVSLEKLTTLLNAKNYSLCSLL